MIQPTQGSFISPQQEDGYINKQLMIFLSERYYFDGLKVTATL
jgi:hypothetical protein